LIYLFISGGTGLAGYLVVIYLIGKTSDCVIVDLGHLLSFSRERER